MRSWRTGMSRASSQPFTNPVATRRPSGVDVSYVIRRSARTRSSIGGRIGKPLEGLAGSYSLTQVRGMIAAKDIAQVRSFNRW